MLHPIFSVNFCNVYDGYWILSVYFLLIKRVNTLGNYYALEFMRRKLCELSVNWNLEYSLT